MKKKFKNSKNNDVSTNYINILIFICLGLINYSCSDVDGGFDCCFGDGVDFFFHVGDHDILFGLFLSLLAFQQR